MWDPLASECLDFFDSVMRRVKEEGSDQMEALIVGDMGCRFLCSRFAIRVLVPSLAKRIHVVKSIMTCM